MIIHWLGEMFDPALAGYWGNADHYGRDGDLSWASSRDNADKIDGIKISLLVQGQGNRDAPPPARTACACIPATTSTTPS